ncbi:HAD family hydrolase [Streptomyces halobius]|uniref:HAD family hydrolase n=2 Tax=Streptomyces halobius TaxID=2879846 RepID=A0ABY4MJQ8_9ACTN|nr:HAD family hydrolase [Streptomyces halobius]
MALEPSPPSQRELVALVARAESHEHPAEEEEPSPSWSSGPVRPRGTRRPATRSRPWESAAAPVAGVEARLASLTRPSLPGAIGSATAVTGSGLLHGRHLTDLHGKATDLDDAAVGDLTAAAEEIAVAERPMAADETVQDLTFLGFVALADPVRYRCRPATARLRDAGVHTVMLTGDHPATADAIAATVSDTPDPTVCTGPRTERTGRRQTRRTAPGRGRHRPVQPPTTRSVSSRHTSDSDGSWR